MSTRLLEFIEKVKIKQIIKQFFRESSYRSKSEISFRNERLRDKLELYGSKSLESIFAELFCRKKFGKLSHDPINDSALFYLFTLIYNFAEPRHGSKIGEMLLWDEVALGFSITGINQNLLLDTLEKIGYMNVVPYLNEYSQKIRRTCNHNAFLQKLTQERIQEIADRINHRLKQFGFDNYNPYIPLPLIYEPESALKI